MNIHLTLKLGTLSIVTALIVSGCVPLTLQNRASVQNVIVGSDVKLPPRPNIQSSGKQLGAAVFGVAGALVAGAASQPGEDALETRLRGAGVDIKAIVRHAFEDELRQTGLPMKPGPATHTLHLDVWDYGLYSNPFLAGRMPYVKINPYITDASGKWVWHHAPVMGGVVDRGNWHSQEEYMKNPQLLRLGWAEAAQRSAREALSTLHP